MGREEREEISLEIKQELVEAVKLASASKTDDSVKGQIYNKAEARIHFQLGLVCASFVAHTHTRARAVNVLESDSIFGYKNILLSSELQHETVLKNCPLQ